MEWIGKKAKLGNTDKDIMDVKILDMSSTGVTSETKEFVLFNPWSSVRFLAWGK